MFTIGYKIMENHAAAYRKGACCHWFLSNGNVCTIMLFLSFISSLQHSHNTNRGVKCKLIVTFSKILQNKSRWIPNKNYSRSTFDSHQSLVTVLTTVIATQKSIKCACVIFSSFIFQFHFKLMLFQHMTHRNNRTV